MCIVSNKLKLCTCNIDFSQIEQLDNYWILYKYAKQTTGNFIIGEPMMPAWFTLESHEVNAEQLVKLLNTENVFDVELELKNKHRLLISLKNELVEDGRDNYGFSYQKGKWSYEDYYWLDWVNEWKQELGGETLI